MEGQNEKAKNYYMIKSLSFTLIKQSSSNFHSLKLILNNFFVRVFKFRVILQFPFCHLYKSLHYDFFISPKNIFWIFETQWAWKIIKTDFKGLKKLPEKITIPLYDFIMSLYTIGPTWKLTSYFILFKNVL